jgi:hypothetical protein
MHTRTPSRIPGRGGLLRSLDGVLRWTDRFVMHRASTADERRWAARLADTLETPIRDALESPGARASLEAVTRRADISRKTRAAEAQEATHG